MTRGYNQPCYKCLKKHNVYEDIQQFKHGRLIGTCPWCQEVGAHELRNPFEYPTGNVAPYLEGEEPYDWEWMDYTMSSDDPEENDNSFDQDNDLIENNLGFIE